MITPERFTEYADGLFGSIIGPTTHSWRLLKELSVPSSGLNLRYFVGQYVAACIDDVFTTEQDLLDNLKRALPDLPNLTPNGLLCPKQESGDEFNDLQYCVADVMRRFEFATISDLVHVPVNVRIIHGQQGEDNRAYATSVWHSDAWAGEPLDAVVVHIMVFGDTDRFGIEFGEMPEEMEHVKMRIQSDYRSAVDGIEIKPYCVPNLQKGAIYLADPRLLHRTKRSGDGIRISIDFRFRLKGSEAYRAYADSLMAPERRENYMAWQDFRKLGKERHMVFSETMEEARAKYRTPASSVKHAVQFTLKDA